ncbi:MAG: hypothetical protein WCH04_14220, partial [Gammaproteobacteria bacterium]
MQIRLTQFLLVPVTTLFCMVAFSWSVPSASQELSFGRPGETGALFISTDQAGNPNPFDVVGGSESLMQQPLLLANWYCRNCVPVCHIDRRGHFLTILMPLPSALWWTRHDSYHWIMKECEGKI